MGKEDFKPISTLAPTFGTDVVDVVMIGADAYRLAYNLKRVQVFAVSMRDLEFQAEKEARPETDPKSVVPKEYHDLLDVFSKKNSDTLEFLLIENMIIKSYWKKNKSMDMPPDTRCHSRNLMQLNVILTHIWLKGSSKQVQLLIRLLFFLLKSLVEELDFVLTIGD